MPCAAAGGWRSIHLPTPTAAWPPETAAPWRRPGRAEPSAGKCVLSRNSSCHSLLEWIRLDDRVDEHSKAIIVACHVIHDPVHGATVVGFQATAQGVS